MKICFLFIFVLFSFFLVSNSKESEYIEDFLDDEEDFMETDPKRVSIENSDVSSFEEFLEDDEESFIDIDRNENEHSKKIKTEEKKEAAPKRPPPKFFNWPKQSHYYYEMILGTFIVTYICFYVLGTDQNRMKVSKFLDEYSKVISSNFARLGNRQKICGNEFIFYTSGRRHISGMVVTFKFKSRHDLIRRAFETIFGYRTFDEVIIDVGMEEMSPFTVAIVNEEEMERYMDDKIDLVNLNIEKLMNDELKGKVFLTDAKDYVSSIISMDIIEILKRNASLFNYIHFSDFQDMHYPSTSKCLRFSFRYPSFQEEKQRNSFLELFNTVFVLIDKISTLKMKKNDLKRIDNENKRNEIRRKLREKIKKEGGQIDKQTNAIAASKANTSSSHHHHHHHKKGNNNKQEKKTQKKRSKAKKRNYY